jgi:hypothetical protein
MQRFVYTPRAYAFTKNGDGQIIDISPWITGGEVRRVVNAVSTATLTLRNPDWIFTTPNADGVTTFMPMDPITIYLRRIKDRPVRVFTGFIDTSPYLELFPGTVTIKASCTLKRLQYTYFDPALPYTQSFLAAYGWINHNGLIWNDDGLNDWKKEQDKQEAGFRDSSIAELLAATLHHIGHWSYDDIHIEKMPEDIFKRMSALYTEFSEDNKELLSEVEDLLKKIIGEGSFGNGDSSPADTGSGGDMSTGNIRGEDKIVKTMAKAAQKWNVPPEIVVATWLIEWPGLKDSPGNKHYGWFQWDNKNGPAGSYSFAVHRSKPNGCYDCGFASDCFAQALRANKNRYSGQDWHWLVQKTQGVNQSAQADNPLYNSAWDAKVAQAKAMVSRYITSGVSATAPGTTLDDAAAGATVRAANVSSTKSSTGTRLDAIIAAANELHSRKTSYSQSKRLGPDSYDCSSSVSYVLSHAGYKPNGPWAATTQTLVSTYGLKRGIDPEHKVTIWIKPFGGQAHAWMNIEGRPFTTSKSTAHGGPGWVDNYYAKDNPSGNGFTPYHLAGLDEPADLPRNADTTVGGASKPAPVTINFDMTDMLPDHRPRQGKPKIIVLHSTEGNNAPGLSDLQGLASVLRGESLSVHVGIDAEGNMARYVPDDQVAFHVANFNPQSLGIEQVGKAAQTSWPEAQTNAAAKMVAYWAQHHDIPIRHSTSHGVCMHSDISKIPGSGTDHTDPGDGYPFQKVLDKASQLATVVGGGADGTASDSGSNDASNKAFANAAAFAATFNAPTLMEGVEAIGLIGEKSLLNDKPLLPFIQQLSEASLRSFQSLPDGTFFGFYPDYFGEMLHHPPYWEIADVEILEGKVELSDDALVTHMYVVGDTTFPTSGNEMMNTLTTAGVISVNNAFMSDKLIESDPDTALIIRKDEAAAFLERFGARPMVEEMPMIHSHFFEMFLAYQRFLLMWSRQFMTTFSFTFMPELFPGGKVGFPNHGLQMYIEDVTHSFDYESGFTTSANLSAPSVYGKTNPRNLPKNMVKAVVNSTGAAAVAAAKQSASTKASDRHATSSANEDSENVGDG